MGSLTLTHTDRISLWKQAAEAKGIYKSNQINVEIKDTC